MKISAIELLRLQQTEVQGTLFVCGMQEIIDLIIDSQRGLFEDLLGQVVRDEPRVAMGVVSQAGDGDENDAQQNTRECDAEGQLHGEGSGRRQSG